MIGYKATDMNGCCGGIKFEVGKTYTKDTAEIEKQRRMTNKELSRWLREKPTREYMYTTNNYIFESFDYREYNKDKEVHKDIMIRENGGEWREPIVEVEE